MVQVTTPEALTLQRAVSTLEDTLDMGCPLLLLMSMPLLRPLVDLEDPRSMAVRMHWVEVWESMVVLDRPSHLKPRKASEAGHLVEVKIHLAPEARTKDVVTLSKVPNQLLAMT